MSQIRVVDDLDAFLDIFPDRIKAPLQIATNLKDLLEVVLDLGRPPEARFPGLDIIIDSKEIAKEDLQYIIGRIGQFGQDNRAGIERTLHRISCLRNRQNQIVGITCRVGRAVFGAVRIIEDMVSSGENILLLGPPGVGKTTMLREVARVLADEGKKRVMIVDTSNEIAGDSDILHPAIGHARRLQVPSPALQHAVMIEAVENHMPEVIVIDEMGTELEAQAARTIAERGVQLIATAHGNTLENLIMNPTLSDLIGGIQSVTLGDDEARRRSTQKTVLERKAPPTFGFVVEIQNWEQVSVHWDVSSVVDAWLRGYNLPPEKRQLDQHGRVLKKREIRHQHSPQTHYRQKEDSADQQRHEPSNNPGDPVRILLFGVGKEKFRESGISKFHVEIADDLQDTTAVLTTKAHYRRGSHIMQQAQQFGYPALPATLLLELLPLPDDALR